MSIVNRMDNIAPKRTTIRETRKIKVDKIIDDFSNRNKSKNKVKKTRNNRKTKNNTKTKSKIKEIIINHIANNIKEYFIVIIIFIIGITAGVIFINNVNEGQVHEIQEYIDNFVEAVKGNYNINFSNLLKTSLIDYLKLVIAMWFIGSTVIGIPIVLGIVLFRGFCIGYTISAGIAVLGTQKGIIFLGATVLLQNIIFIPVLLAMAVSGINLYKSIMKDKRKENIKLEIVRHTLSSISCFCILILAAFIESYVSTNLFNLCINFF